MAEKKFRLVTRSDMDGLVCAVLLKELDLVDNILFVHPKEMQDGKIAVSENDITTNLPYVPGVHIAFDHHLSETIRNEKRENHIIDPEAPSAARVVYDYYGGKKIFPANFDSMMTAVDKADAAQFSMQDVLNPSGWEFLSFLMDSRTGLGRFKEFRISNYQLMMDLIDYCRYHNIDDIFKLPDVAERAELYYKYSEDAKAQLKKCSKVHGQLVVYDTRFEDPIYPTNRFMIYALFPQVNISIHILWGMKKQNTVFAVGKSIFNRSCNISVGELMLRYGGGGHEAAGTCQVENDNADEILQELIAELNRVTFSFSM